MDNVPRGASPQRSRQWYIERMGKVTGSNMHRALMGPRGRTTYIRELINERALLEENGPDLDTYINRMMTIDTAAMAWGRKHEPYARARLEMLLDVDIREVGFCIHPCQPNTGCSVDGAIDGQTIINLVIAEIKCPYNTSVHHTNCLLNGVDSYKPQIQGNIWVTNAAGCHFASFDPRASLELQFFTQYIPRDDVYLGEILVPAVYEILGHVDNKTLPEAPDTIPSLF